MKRPSPLAIYIAGLALLTVPIIGFAGKAYFAADHQVPWVMVIMLTAGVLVGEAMPVDIARGRNTSAVTFSFGFLFAIVLVSPLFIPCVIQVGIIVIQHLWERRPLTRLVFNVGQYAITLWAAHWSFVLLSGRSTLDLVKLDPMQLLAVAGAGIVLVSVNHVLVSTVVALSSGQGILRSLTTNIRMKLLPSGMDMGLAPLSIPVLHFSPLLFPLLVLPAAVLHYSAKLAVLREHEALHDVLTGLPNRALLHQSFGELIPEVISGERHLAVMLIDLDHFKEINDTLGHQVGDALLCEVAERLMSVHRDGDTVARLGGDEFAVLASVDAAHALEEATGLAQRLIEALEQPFTADGVRMDVQGSVGIALAPDHGLDAEVLMSRADIALYVAKERRGCYSFFDPNQEERAPERLSLLGELREAIEKRELEVFYQPKFDVRHGVVLGSEALVRWRHPVRGLIPPDQFIPAAEKTGLIVPLTHYVLDVALAQTREWLDRGWQLGVAVNLSVRSLGDTRLSGEVAELLERHRVPAHLLTLEVTESMLMSDPSKAAAVLQPLRDQGVSIAIDDYGTGYSSLAYLRSLDIDELKIDRSLIVELSGPGQDEVIVRSTIDLGHNLGLRVVAEGVEDRATVEFLDFLGCDMVQGWVCSPAVPAEAFTAFIEAGVLMKDSLPTTIVPSVGAGPKPRRVPASR